MQEYKFLILNGPNLGFIGQRQPDIYGEKGMDDLPKLLKDTMGPKSDNIQLVFYQSNIEGELINRLESCYQNGLQGVVLNAGAYTHTSLALADCLAWIDIPCVEVHLSNIWSRQETLRHQSLIAGKCLGVVAGFGVMSYVLAVIALWQHLQQANV